MCWGGGEIEIKAAAIGSGDKSEPRRDKRLPANGCEKGSW